MANKRMFKYEIIASDKFIDMPLSAQALYFHLCIRADDDGFVGNPKSVRRSVGASEDDLKLLIAKEFCIPFESGVIVIKHWRINNNLRKDRYHASIYPERNMLLVTYSGEYSLVSGTPLPQKVALQYDLPLNEEDQTQYGIPMVDQRYTKISIDKDSTDKNSIDNDKKEELIITTFVDFFNYSFKKNFRKTKKNKGIIQAALSRVDEEQLNKIIENEARRYRDGEYSDGFEPNITWLFGSGLQECLNRLSGADKKAKGMNNRCGFEHNYDFDSLEKELIANG